jgi:hypothetical protein
VSPARLAAFVTLCALIPLGAMTSQAREQLPEVSHDGLHLVKDKGFAALYMKPGASMAPYDELIILDCFVAFKKNWQQDQEETDDFVTAKQMDAIKTQLAREFRRVFVKELQDKGGYKVVTEGGRNVMILRPAIINLDVVGPDSASDIDEQTFSASAGQMTLYMELYDSLTSDIIARIIDPESGQGSGMIEWRNEVTNAAEVDRILRRWADIMRQHLDDARKRTAQ